MPAPALNRPLWTIGQIAAATGQPIHRIRYLIDRLELQPAMRAGTYRMFDAASVQELLRRIEKRTLRAG